MPSGCTAIPCIAPMYNVDRRLQKLKGTSLKTLRGNNISVLIPKLRIFLFDSKKQTIDSMMQFILVTYDIENDRRRTKIHKVLEGYGISVQYSVFECFISTEEYAQLRTRLQKLLDPNHQLDSIRYYVMCRNCVERVDVDGNRNFEIQSPFIIS